MTSLTEVHPMAGSRPTPLFSAAEEPMSAETIKRERAIDSRGHHCDQVGVGGEQQAG